MDPTMDPRGRIFTFHTCTICGIRLPMNAPRDVLEQHLKDKHPEAYQEYEARMKDVAELERLWKLG
jgi:hypothetical protein